MRVRRLAPMSRKSVIHNKSPAVWQHFLKDLCNNLSLHGLPHIARQDRFLCERYELWMLNFQYQWMILSCELFELPAVEDVGFRKVLWAILVTVATLAMVVVGYNSWLAYRHPTVTTTVATTRNDCANIPFPSLTICDTSRVDWRRALQLTQRCKLAILTPEKVFLDNILGCLPAISFKCCSWINNDVKFNFPRDIPNGGNITLDKVLVLLKALADMTFGDFDFMETLTSANLTSEDFGQIDIEELLRKVQRSCSEVFHGMCWWRENYHDCCSLFEVQRTDLGFCYSFNNDLSEPSHVVSWGYGRGMEPQYWRDWTGEVRPRRASTSGPWTGLRMTVEVMSSEQLPTGTNITPGVMFYLEEPRSFPNSENQRIDPATFVDIRVYGITLQAERRVRFLDFEDRNCLFMEERVGWTGAYNEHNCLAECSRDYAKAYCNCSPDFLFIYNVFFNSLEPKSGHEFFQSQTEGMQCDCPADCNSQQYMFDTSISQTQNLSHIGFDLHYKGKYNMLYKTDVMYGPMEFLVALGGIAGLFLGGSLLSAVEILYFFTFRLFYHWKQTKRAKAQLPPVVKFVYPKY
ncbi:uncharacterized protein LOC124360996 [Homalodisca vitripennis]|uniref:uncharacterized protein LOC124360996 n=1 Tax=Homalodisca vitripennis TaxID=197043 RepID=UPI001EEC9BC2|nr:uncharacterized protein LOC124360996 [Homalodisca vitripennis]